MNIKIFLIGSLIWSLTPVGHVTAQSVLRTNVYLQPHSDPFALGQSVVRPQTPLLTLDQLAAGAAGQVSERAFRRYSTFENYLRASQARSGNVFEALIVHQDNQRWASLGRSERLLATAIEGNVHHPADLLLLGQDGAIARQYQAKMEWSAAVRSLSDPRFANMSIVTSSESLAIIEGNLLRHEQSALRRGILLREPWTTVRQALDEGRLLQSLPSGAMLPTRAEAQTLARQVTEQGWRAIEAQVGEKTGILAQTGKVVGKVLIVVDVAGTGYATCQDVGRYQAGDIGAGYLGLKTGLHATNLILTYYAVVSPEPTTKAAAAVAVVVIVVVEVGIELAHETISGEESRATQKLLESIDRDERHLVVRRLLVSQMKGLDE